MVVARGTARRRPSKKTRCPKVAKPVIRIATREAHARFDELAAAAQAMSGATTTTSTSTVRWAVLGRNGDVVPGAQSSDLRDVRPCDADDFGTPARAWANVATAELRPDWVTIIMVPLRAILSDMYGSVDAAMSVMSTVEFKLAVDRSFVHVQADARVHVTREAGSVRSICTLARAIGFNLSKAVWRDKNGKTIIGRLASMTPKYVPAVGDTVKQRCDVQIFILDLGSGTRTYERAVQQFHLNEDEAFVVISIDWDPKTKPTFVHDITKWRNWYPGLVKWMHGKYPTFAGWHLVHFSGDCKELSATKAGSDRDIGAALWLVLAGAALLTEIGPPAWTMEHSASGPAHLATHSVMRPLDSHKLPALIHFCKAAGLGNYKPGAWWTNMCNEAIAEILSFQCTGNDKCLFSWFFGAHFYVSQRGGRIRSGGRLKGKMQRGMRRDDYMGIPVMISYAWMTAAVRKHIPFLHLCSTDPSVTTRRI